MIIIDPIDRIWSKWNNTKCLFDNMNGPQPQTFVCFDFNRSRVRPPKSPSVTPLWFQESHRQVGPAAHGDSVHRLHVRDQRPAAGTQQLGGLDRELFGLSPY